MSDQADHIILGRYVIQNWLIIGKKNLRVVLSKIIMLLLIRNILPIYVEISQVMVLTT